MTVNGKTIRGRKFALSAVMASLVLVFGEQAVLVVWSPRYFSSIGEWIWNLFVSISFLWTFVTLYAFAGGACWQTLAGLADPFGRLATHFRASRENEATDLRVASFLAGVIGASGFLAFAVFLTQRHFSSAYNNKALAAFLFTLILFGLLPLSLVAFAWSRTLARRILLPLGRVLPQKLFLTELLLVAAGSVLLLGYLAFTNSHILEMVDLKPWALVGLFFVAQAGLYLFFSLPGGASVCASVFNNFSAGGWSANLAIMLAFTILAYPSQPRVASILRNQAPLSRPVILGIQRLADQDRDGFSPLLRGGDCNDANPLVHPMAQEIPGNGVDEDCMGGDGSKIVESDRKIDDLLALRIESLRKTYNVVLITVDAWRMDHLGVGGYSRSTSPEIDAFAKESVLFTHNYAQAPNTPQSIPSLISGMYPSQVHWSRYTNFPKVKPQTKTLIEMLKTEGYHTAGVFSYWYFDNRDLDRGADHWDNRAFRERDHSERVSTDDLVTDHAIEHLESIKESREPLFLWMHYFDPHFLYVRHAGIDFGNRQMDLYDGEIRSNSRELGRFLDYFKKTPWYKNSIIVITGDHGEEFGEHGRNYHGAQLYQESVRVPLIVHVPGVQPRTVDRSVGNIDIVPTVLDLCGMRDKGRQLQGRSLAPLILDPENAPPRPVYIEKLSAPTFPWSLQALLSDRWKIIYRADEDLFELYDLETDPAESKDLSEDLPEKTENMRMQLSDFRQQYLHKNTGWYLMATAGRK